MNTIEGINTARVPSNNRRFGFVIRMGAAHNDIRRLDYREGKIEGARIGSKFGKRLAAHAADLFTAAPAGKKKAA